MHQYKTILTYFSIYPTISMYNSWSYLVRYRKKDLNFTSSYLIIEREVKLVYLSELPLIGWESKYNMISILQVTLR